MFAAHLAEVCIDILSTQLVQLSAADLLGKAGDADNISRFKVLDEEIAARFGHILHLIPCGKRQKHEEKNHYFLNIYHHKIFKCCFNGF